MNQSFPNQLRGNGFFIYTYDFGKQFQLFVSSLSFFLSKLFTKSHLPKTLAKENIFLHCKELSVQSQRGREIAEFISFSLIFSPGVFRCEDIYNSYIMRLLGAYTFIIAISSWYIDPFIFMTCCSLYLGVFLARNPSLLSVIVI